MTNEPKPKLDDAIPTTTPEGVRPQPSPGPAKLEPTPERAREEKNRQS